MMVVCSLTVRLVPLASHLDGTIELRMMRSLAVSWTDSLSVFRSAGRSPKPLVRGLATIAQQLTPRWKSQETTSSSMATPATFSPAARASTGCRSTTTTTPMAGETRAPTSASPDSPQRRLCQGGAPCRKPGELALKARPDYRNSNPARR